MGEYFRIPSLGQHYTQRWAKEELENERQKSAASGNTNNATSGTNEAGGVEIKDEPGKMLKKAETAVAEEAPFGEMTQR